MELFGLVQPSTALRIFMAVTVLDLAVIYLVPYLLCGQGTEPPSGFFLQDPLSFSSSSSVAEGLDKLERALDLRMALTQEMGEHLAELRANIQALKSHYTELQALSQSIDQFEAATQRLQENGMKTSDVVLDTVVAEKAKPKVTVGSARGSKSQ